MARKGQGTAREPNASGSSYRASLTILAFLVACLTALTLVALEFSSLNPLLHTLTSDAGTPTRAQIERAAPFVAIPVGAAIGAYLIGRRLIWLARIQIYRRHLHGYLKQWLRTYAPLAEYDVAPLLIPDGDGETRTGERQSILVDWVRERQMVLLSGEAATGKTVALHQLAYELTRKRALLPLWFGRLPLPVMLFTDAPAMLTSDLASGDEPSLDDRIRDALRHFGTRGLAAAEPRLRHRGKLALLCDGLDALAPTQRARLLREYTHIARRGQKVAVVLTRSATRPAVARNDDSNGDVEGWRNVYLAPLREDQILRITRRSRSEPRSGRPTPGPATADMLAPSLTSPACLAALVQASFHNSEVPAGRAALLRETVTRAFSAGVSTAAESALALKLVGAVAAGLRTSGTHAIRTSSSGSLGRTLADWLERVELSTPTATLEEDAPLFRPEELEAMCRHALRAGILVRDPQKRMLRFANRLLEATCAAVWLEATDSGLGRLRPELLQPEWLQPMLLWAGAAEHPGDITFRLLRLLETPESASVRAGFASPDDYQAAVLALALGTACECYAPLLAGNLETESDAGQSRTAGPATNGTSPHPFALAEEQLRDLLDRVFRQIETPDQQEAMRTALAELTDAGGHEVLTHLRFLATYARLQRLLRAQVIVVLGLIGSPDAMAIVVALLDDPDALTRQAVERALGLAGARALPALRHALSHPSQRVRTRVAEALAQLGDPAVDAAIAGLAGQRPEQRIAAARTLGALRAERGAEALSVRLQRDGDSGVRVAAALALGLIGQIGSTQAVEALEQAAASESAAVRSAVAQALGAARAVQSLTTLLRLLGDSEPRVRASAAAALGMLGDDRAVAALQERRDDQDPWTQNAVVLSLRRLGN